MPTTQSPIKRRVQLSQIAFVVGAFLVVLGWLAFAFGILAAVLVAMLAASIGYARSVLRRVREQDATVDRTTDDILTFERRRRQDYPGAA